MNSKSEGASSLSHLESPYSQATMLSLNQSLRDSSSTAGFLATLIAVASFISSYVFYWPRMKFPSTAPGFTSLSYPLFGSTGFFTRRWDFYRHSIAESKTGNFSFFLAKHPVVGLSGDVGRQVFFESRQLH